MDVWDGGSTRYGAIDPAGAAGLTDVVFDYFHYVDVGANGGAVRLDETVVTTTATLIAPNKVRSAGWFYNQFDQVVEWVATSWIDPGSQVYQTRLDFTTSGIFGAIRMISYLDEDVYSYWTNHLIVLGSGANVQLLTLDSSENVGVAQAVQGLSNVQYLGWAADEYADLKNAIQGSGASYSIAGVVDLPPITDPRYPGLPAYGPRDITTAFAFDLAPGQSSASLIFALGGSPSGQPPMPVIPEPGTMTLLGVGLLPPLLSLRKRTR
ncbi:MAG: hypothetical protein HPY54_16995 [Chthonomonadetes bacterium]|nr:hypothetical protein [Chthonomonadetes bacterium]